MALVSVKGYEGFYWVNRGGVVAGKNYKILQQFENHHGYLRVNLCRPGYKSKQVFVHRLVAEAHIGEIPEGYQVNHKDGNKLNNHVSNLEIVTASDNTKHDRNVLGHGIKAVVMMTVTGEEIGEFKSLRVAANSLNIDETSICKCCKGERKSAGGYVWKYKG